MSKPRRRKRAAPVLMILLILLCGGLLFLYSQQNWIQTEYITVSNPSLPAAFQGLRIALVSDLHGKEFGENNETLLSAVAELEPDLIAITGDVVDQKSQLGILPALARGLSALAPTYYVTGNHEWAERCVSDVRAVLRENGVTPLTNEYVSFEKDGAVLALAGVDDPNGPADQKSPQDVADVARADLGDPYILMLAHRNDQVTAYRLAAPDLVLCGHAHGGLIRLPFTDGLVGNDRKFFPQYTAGYYDLGETALVVSRGLGNNTTPIRSFRLFNRPHLPLVILSNQ